MSQNIQGHEAVGGATKRGKPDPSVVLPDSVKAQADRANALMEQAKTAREQQPLGSNAPIGETLKPPAPRVPPAGVITANFDPKNPNPPDPNDSRLFAPQPGQNTGNGAAPPPPVPVTPQNESDWEHQFKSLKGRYDREAEDKRRLQEQNVQQQRLLAQMNAAPTPQGGNPGEGSGVRFNVAPPPPGKRVTAQEIQEFGPELMDVVGRRAAEVYEPIIQQLAGELATVKRQVGGVQNTVVFDARVKMYDDLARALPNWDAINNSPQFGQWLDQIDPISHQSRRTFLNQAHNSNATGQVLDIFNSFLSAYGAANPQPTQGNGAGVTHQSNPNPTPPQFDLRQYAAPGKAKEGQTQVPPEKPKVTRAEIKQFYTQKTQGVYAGREAEAARIEALIFEAGNEGRIVG